MSVETTDRLIDELSISANRLSAAIQKERDDAQIQIKRMQEALDDILKHGLRCDMGPTWNMSLDSSQMYSSLCTYFRRAEEHLKARAADALYGDK